jgi:hypothetical protein
LPEDWTLSGLRIEIRNSALQIAILVVSGRSIYSNFRSLEENESKTIRTPGTVSPRSSPPNETRSSRKEPRFNNAVARTSCRACWSFARIDQSLDEIKGAAVHTIGRQETVENQTFRSDLAHQKALLEALPS